MSSAAYPTHAAQCLLYEGKHLCMEYRPYIPCIFRSSACMKVPLLLVASMLRGRAAAMGLLPVFQQNSGLQHKEEGHKVKPAVDIT